MTPAYQKLETHFKRLAHIGHALTFLSWDQLVMMPSGGNDSRTEAVAELSGLYHDMLVAPEIGDLLEDAAGEELDSDLRVSLVEMEREYRLASCVPADLVKAKSRAGSKCEHGWRVQRAENDWSGFQANFKEVVNLSRQEAQARQAAASDSFPTPYDALLDLYCTGDSAEMIENIFSTLKESLPGLLNRVVEHQENRDVQISGTFPVEQQKLLNRELMIILGFDFSEGRVDESSHPFSTGVRGDHRITTRFRTEDFIDALKATAHETGHASYESGLPHRWEDLPVGQARNLSLHESQSLLFEKQLFLAPSFISFFTPRIHAHLTEATSFDTEQIWQACTMVKPSYIRVEADEVSYPLHVILRFELEKALINGDLETADIPEAWDHKMTHYLGLSTEGNYRDGCLQDIHWTDGSFGYFPAYTLGAINGVQIFNAFCREYPDWEERFSRGEIIFMRDWLQEHIWCKGRTLSSQHLLEEATGEGTNPEHFLTYIRKRYLDDRI